eukprot:jgi/Botrbrau1/15551/Bobra.0273s0003.1
MYCSCTMPYLRSPATGRTAARLSSSGSPTPPCLGTQASGAPPRYRSTTQHYSLQRVPERNLFLVPSVYLRWRCSRYHPERTLVVPQASMEVLTDPSGPTDQSEDSSTDESSPPDRDIFLLFKASCQQPKGFFSQGKKFRQRPGQGAAGGEGGGHARPVQRGARLAARTTMS